jgi:hypothetical protein
MPVYSPKGLSVARIWYARGEPHLYRSLISGDDPSLNQEVRDGREKIA